MDGTLPRGTSAPKKTFGFKNKRTKKQKKATPFVKSSITISEYAQGCISLGTIRSVEDDAVYVDLPGGNKGVLLFTEVNDYFLQNLQKAVEENKTSLQTLTDFFKVDSYLMAVVLSAGTNPVELSIRPSLINIGIPVCENSVFYAAVKSKEDNGFLLDIGNDGFNCFLPEKDADGKKRSLKIGQPIFVKVIKADKDSKIARFDLIDSSEYFPSVDESTPQFDVIRPYSVIDSVVKSNPPSGALKLLVGGTFNGVCSKFSWPAGLNQGDSVKARPILIDPAQKTLWMSTIPSIVMGARPHCFNVRLGEIVEADVLRIRSGIGIECNYIKDGKESRIFIDIENTEADSSIAAGDKHTIRIIERRPIDDILFAADDKETLNLEVFCVEDAIVGHIYDGTVVQLHPKFGAFVKISKFLTGLAPLAYCDDTSKLQKGTEVKAIVLSKENGQLRLALKEKLINSHYMRILTLDDVRKLIHAREIYETKTSELNENQQNESTATEENELKSLRKNQYTHVIVKKVVKSGMIVEMFNGLVAMIPAQYLPIQHGSDVSKIYQPGHVLRARVVTLDGDKINCSVTATDDVILQLGLEITVKIIGFTSDAVQVQLPSKYGQFNAIIPNTHFSDNLDLSQRIRDCMTIGKKLRGVLLRLPGISAPAVLTRKQAFKQFVNLIPRSNDEMSVSQTYFGYVNAVQPYGSFISFFGRASGLIHNQQLRRGETVNAYVQKADNGHISLTIPAEFGESELYIKNYLYDSNHNFKPPFDGLDVEIKEPPEALGSQYLYNLPNNWKGVSIIKALEGETLQVAYFDYVSNTAILDRFDVGALEIAPGTDIKATVVGVIEPVIVAKYENHIVLAPTNNYNNHSSYSDYVKIASEISLTTTEPYNNTLIGIPSYLTNAELSNKVDAEITAIGTTFANLRLRDGRSAKIHRSQINANAKEGDIIKGQLLTGNKSNYVVTDPTSPQHFEDFKVGMSVTGFVTKVVSDFLQLSLSPFTKGTIHAMQLSASDRKLISKPLQENFSEGDRIEGFVIGENQGFILVSAINPSQSTQVHFARVLHVKPGDYAEVSLGMNDRRYIDVTDVSDDFKFNPLRSFKEGQVIDVCLIPGDEKHVSTRQSAFEGNFPTVEIKEGKVMQGYVSHHSDGYLLVRLSRGVTGKLSRNKIADSYIKNPQDLFPDGSVVTVKIESISKDGTKISLSSRRSDIEGKLLTFEDIKVGDKLNGFITGCNEHGVFVTLMDYHKISGLVHRSNLDNHDPLEWQTFINSRAQVEVEEIDPEKKRINLKLVELQTNTENKSSESESDESSSDEENQEQLNEIDLDFDDNQEPDNDTEVIQRKLKLSEKEIAQLEANQLKPTIPKNAQEFNRMVSAAPSSSYLWVKFIEFYYANGNIEEAKATCERALEKIPIGETSEKINVFISYINLSVLTASKEHFIEDIKDLVLKAAQSTDKARIWSHFGVFVSAQRPEFETDAWKLALKHCKGNLDVWVRYLETLMNEGKFQFAREEQKRGFNSFEAMGLEDRWKLVERFGILEFRNGNVEHGRTVFENLLKAKQNQFDYWNIYADMETKYGDANHARAIYDRLAHTDLNANRMRATLKKWMNFETLHGDDPSRKAHIKQIAIEYRARNQ